MIARAISAVALISLFGPIAHAQTAPPPAPRLQVAVVVRIDSPVLLDAGGAPAPGTSRALAEIDASLRQLARIRAPFALSASPLWLDELLATGQPRVYGTLLSLAARRPLLRVPYTREQLSLRAEPDAIVAELSRGESAIRETLQAASQRILDPPALALSTTVLAAARASGLAAALAPAETIGPEPVRVRDVVLIPTDEVPQIGSLPDRFGTHGRIAVVLRPSGSLPRILASLAADKRVRLVNIGDVISRPATLSLSLPAAGPPPRAYRDAVARAGAALDGLRSYTVGEHPTIRRLSVLFARAASNADWRMDWDEGTARAQTAADLAEREQSLISASEGTVTLTSRRGVVPVTLTNRAPYPVRLRVSVSSAKLRFPAGATKTVTVSPRGVTITFVAEARSTGSFPMNVAVSSPNGRVRFDGGRVIVRSTAANVLALVLTLSGLLFLVGWSSRDLIRKAIRRRAR